MEMLLRLKARNRRRMLAILMVLTATFILGITASQSFGWATSLQAKPLGCIFRFFIDRC